jgi:diguanylate cyclase (GGDEF)-like protein
VDEALNRSFEGPPDHTPFTYGIASWDVGEVDGLRSGLVVPLGEGSLAVYSRLANAFDAEAARILATIARQAEPAVLNAFRYLEIEERAATDLRTGLGSASAFEEALPREISAARRHGRPLCLIQIDLDDFGRINKVHGQAAGDGVLTEFGKRLRSAIRGSDSAFRNSGGADEFFVILPETTREEARRSYARFAFEMATEPFAAVGAVTMSSGLVELRSGDSPETLKSRADRLALQAKVEGKDRLLTDEDA